MNKKKQLNYTHIIYTDGGCSFNPGGTGACAAVIIETDTGEIVEYTQGYQSTTNNRMEVMAAIMALEKTPEHAVVQLFSDSEYLVHTLNGVYSKKKNMDLWKQLSRMMQTQKVVPVWVRGHHGDHYNERCDELCNQAMQSEALIWDAGYDQNLHAAEKEIEKKGAMGIPISVPDSFPNRTIRHDSMEEYCKQYQVHEKCARSILSLLKNPKPNFKSYMEIRTDGIDYWSRKPKKTLEEQIPGFKDAWNIALQHLGDDKKALSCMRWYARGLSLKDSIRKVLVDEEVAYHCIRH